MKHAAGLLRSGQQVQRTGQLTSKVADAAANRAALEKAEKLVEGVRPELIAPRKILEAVRVGVEESFAAGLAAEQAVFRDCMACWSTQNKIYVLSSTRQTAQLPGGEETTAKRIATAGVLGMGTMGTGIAQALVSAGIRVTACDSNPSALEAAQGKIRSSIERRVRQGKMSPQKAERAVELLGISADAGALAESELVIEAVFEDEAVKREAIGRLESICRPDCLIATNTSTINLDVLADGMRHPDRLLGLHFFHPAQQMPLVEVIHRKSTPAEVLAAGVQVVKSLGKTPVLVRNREGFVVNRVFLPYLKEAFRLLEEGAEPSDDRRGHGGVRSADGPACVDRYVGAGYPCINRRHSAPGLSPPWRTVADCRSAGRGGASGPEDRRRRIPVRTGRPYAPRRT